MEEPQTQQCMCLVCQVHDLVGWYPSLAMIAAGEYVVTHTRGITWPRMCHPDGCPADPRSRARITRQEFLVLPGVEPSHLGQSQGLLYLCDRVACARVPGQQARVALRQALQTLGPGPRQTQDPFPGLMSKIKRSRSPRTFQGLETAMLAELREIVVAERHLTAEDLAGFPSLLEDHRRRYRLERAIEAARTVAALLPKRTPPAVVGIAGPDQPFEVHVNGWRPLLSSYCDDIIPALLRSDAREQDGQLVFIVPGQALPSIGWQWQFIQDNDEPAFVLDDDTITWIRQHLPPPPPVTRVIRPSCNARNWWNSTYSPRKRRPFPLPDHDPNCGSSDLRQAVNKGEVSKNGEVKVRIRTGTWHLDEHLPDGRLRVLGTEESAGPWTPGVQVTSSTRTFLNACCRLRELQPLDAVADAVRALAHGYRPKPLIAELDDLTAINLRVLQNLTVAHRDDGLLTIHPAAPRPVVPRARRADPQDLPPGFNDVLATRRRPYLDEATLGFDRQVRQARAGHTADQLRLPQTLACTLCGEDFDPEHLDPDDYVAHDPFRWCPSCLSLRWGSAVADRDIALVRVAHFARVLGRAPGKDWARENLPHHLPGHERDRLLAARMAMPNDDSLRRLGLSGWGETLVDAGVLTDGLKTARGIGSRAADGHWCRSLFELTVDDFFTTSGIPHECEPGWPHHPTLNANTLRRADWLLQDGTYVEAAGMMGDARYAQRISEKQQLADAVGVRLVIVEPADLARLSDLFSAWADPR